MYKKVVLGLLESSTRLLKKLRKFNTGCVRFEKVDKFMSIQNSNYLSIKFCTFYVSLALAVQIMLFINI